MKINKDTLIPLFLSFLIVVLVFVIDLQIPLGVAGGVPYIAAILVALWLQSSKLVVLLALICSFLTVLGYYLSPQEGELWKVIFNRALALFAIWVTAILAIKWNNSQQRILRIMYDAEKEAEKEQEKKQIFVATLHGAQHITNNLLNQLQLVELEIKNHKNFDQETVSLFKDMMKNADKLLTNLSSVKQIEVEIIRGSVHPENNKIDSSQKRL